MFRIREVGVVNVLEACTMGQDVIGFLWTLRIGRKFEIVEVLLL
jgi:hypothetical protein